MFHTKRLVVILMILTVMSGTMSSQLSKLSVHALTPYDMAYDIGCNDVGKSISQTAQYPYIDPFIGCKYEY